MTFLSISPDTFDFASAGSRPAVLPKQHRTSRSTRLGAALAMSVALTVPGAVAQAKWTRLQLIVSILQHRCLDGLST